MRIAVVLALVCWSASAFAQREGYTYVTVGRACAGRHGGPADCSQGFAWCHDGTRSRYGCVEASERYSGYMPAGSVRYLGPARSAEFMARYYTVPTNTPPAPQPTPAEREASTAETYADALEPYRSAALECSPRAAVAGIRVRFNRSASVVGVDPPRGTRLTPAERACMVRAFADARPDEPDHRARVVTFDGGATVVADEPKPPAASTPVSGGIDIHRAMEAAINHPVTGGPVVAH